MGKEKDSFTMSSLQLLSFSIQQQHRYFSHFLIGEKISSPDDGSVAKHRSFKRKKTFSSRAKKNFSKQEKLNINQIGSLHLHGTGTQQNDLIESHALHAVFGSPSQQPIAWANKAITGHALGVSPLFQLVLALQAMRHSRVPATTHCDHLDPACKIRMSRGEAFVAAPAVCLNSGFWGNVSSIIVSP